MKYKVGDKVRIKPLEEFIQVEGINRDGFMNKYCGELATISKITDIEKFPYKINIDNGRWCWNDDMFEDAEPAIDAIKINEFLYRMRVSSQSQGIMLAPSNNWTWSMNSIPSPTPYPLQSKTKHSINLIGKHKYLTLKIKA